MAILPLLLYVIGIAVIVVSTVLGARQTQSGQRIINLVHQKTAMATGRRQRTLTIECADPTVVNMVASVPQQENDEPPGVTPGATRIVFSIDDQPTGELDNFRYFQAENVVQYHFFQFNKWLVDVNNNVSKSDDASTDRGEFMVIDMIMAGAFAHWVYESAIYLETFRALKNKRFPNLKLLLPVGGYTPRRTWKDMFLRFFGIDESEVMYEMPKNPAGVYIFPHPISAINNRVITDMYKLQIDRMFYVFNSYESANRMLPQTDFVVLPRQSKENFTTRVSELDDTIVCLQKKGYSVRVLETDQIESVDEQMRVLASGRKIGVTDGSPCLPTRSNRWTSRCACWRPVETLS